MPSRRFYMVMLLIAGASALFAFGIMFGVGVVTAPPERKMTATAERLATPDGVRRAPAQIGASKALTPIYPANPGPADPAAESTETVKLPETFGSGANSTTGDGANTIAGDDAAVEIVANEPVPAARVDQPPQAEPAQIGTPAATAEEASTATAGEPQTATIDEIKPSAPAMAEARTGVETATAKPGMEAVTLRKPGRCDVSACSAAYRSFRASDCTYQPFEGPRQLCENPPAAQSTQKEAQSTQKEEEPRREAAREPAPANERDEDADLRAAVEAVKALTEPPSAGRRLVPLAERSRGRAESACNVTACARAYDSFDPSDCTFQPFGGPRQLCTR